MIVSVFKEMILVPPKCGSRFFEEHWGNRKILKPGSKLGSNEWVDIINKEYVVLNNLKNSHWINKVQYIVLRNPLEFMLSAFHTEFMSHWNISSNGWDEEQLIQNVLGKDTQSHWYRHFFKELYLFALKFEKPPTIIMLDDLNDFMENVMGENYSKGFSKSKYDFSAYPIWLSKNDLMDTYIKEKYPSQWERIHSYLKGDEFFWKQLSELCPIYTPTIKEDTKKISLKNDLPPNPPAAEYTKTVWCFGDSFTEGSNANRIDSPYSIWRGGPAKCIGYFLGEKLKCNWVNLGEGAISNADIFEAICLNIPKIESGDVISIGFSAKHRFRLANTKTDRWARFQANQPLSFLPNDISEQTINEILVNRDSPLYQRELKYWIQLLKYTFKDNRVIIWDWQSGKAGFDGNRFQTIQDETNGELDDVHWSETGNKQFADWFVNKLNTGQNFINMIQ